MPLRLIQGPIAEPVSLAEAKLHLRVDVTDDDALISAFIAAARDYAETITRRCFIAQSWKYVIDSFPGPTLIGIPFGQAWVYPGHAVFLEKSQVQYVSAIKYTDMNSNAQVMASTDYAIDYTSEPCRITPIFGRIWPITLPQIGAAEIDFVAGYAAPIVANTSTGTIAVQGAWAPSAVGDVIRLSNSGGALPTPLQPLTDYYVASVVSPGIYTLSATSGGAAIALSDTGSGNSFIGAVPEGIKAWMKVRIGAMYQRRAEFALTEKGSKLEPLPFVDRLLDPYTVLF